VALGITYNFTIHLTMSASKSKPKDNPGPKAKRTRNKKKSKTPNWSKLHRINHRAAAVDIGSQTHLAAVDPELVEPGQCPVRTFGTVNCELDSLVAWFLKLGVQTVALEATGVYWLALVQKLTDAGIECIVVNPRDIKQIAGRKSDVQDCQWIQTLHSYGLLRPCFLPDGPISQLRTLTRQRQNLVEMSSDAIRRMQKALQEMNVQLHHAVSDIHGVTGLRIIQAILEGERRPEELVKLRDKACRRTSPEEMAEALRGTWDPALLKVLGQQYAQYDFTHRQMDDLDTDLAQKLEELAPYYEAQRATKQRKQAPKASGKKKKAAGKASTKATGAGRPKRIYKLASNGKRRSCGPNVPQIDYSVCLERICGTDLCSVTGLNLLNTLLLIGEIGVDMSHWETAKHFSSWLGLSPNNRQSGKRMLSTHTRKVQMRASEILRQAAQTLRQSQSVLGEFYRRLAARKGPAQATVATARKLACLIYYLLKDGESFEIRDVEEYRQEVELKRLRALEKKVRRLGYELVKKEPEPVAA